MTKPSQPPNLSGKVKVAVRVRPFNKREIDLNTRCVVDMNGDQTYLIPTEEKHENSRKQAKTFTFDHCFWSMDSSEREKFSDQEHVFKSLGLELLDNAFSGYNACIFAYGQTGSGKSYSMMGGQDQPGLIPRLCDALFDRIDAETKKDASFKVEVSYMEIYNEKVRDLLDPSGGRQQLKVREHKVLGPYVDGLQQLLANSASVVQEFMSQGSKSRTVAATKMNAESSRSHAVFTLIVTHTILDLRSGVSGERVSKLSLVDLAGSERSSKTGASGARLKEGSNINKSLTTLGLVISALADQSSGKNKNKFVPYRDSTLTWILKDNLGGNSKTTMVATLSPSADNYEETLSTLRYADRAKRIVNKAVVNEDPNARIIRELREEVEKLQTQLKQSESMRAPDLNEKLRESERLIQTISQTWEEKLRKTEFIHKQRQETLEKMGISLADSGIKLEKAKCFLVNLNADPSLNELLVYYLKPLSLVGQSAENDIQLSGLGISSKHAELRVVEEGGSSEVTVTPLEDARTCVNGRAITSICRLRHGDRILWGNNHFFRINIPRGLKREDDPLLRQPEAASIDIATKPDNHLNETLVGYELAQQEVLLNQADAPLQETLTNLEREFQRLQKEGNSPYKEMSESISYSKLDDAEREKYEQEIESLRRQVHRLAPPTSQDVQHQSMLTLPLQSNGAATSPTRGYHNYKTWKEERETIFQTSISQLRSELVRAQALTREANALALEMHKKTEFTVTLRIPTHNLTPNRKHGMLLCEPAIQVVRDGKESKVWSVENLSNKLFEMRDMYETYKQAQEDASHPSPHRLKQKDQPSGSSVDPFTETNHGQVLIGVANVFLTCLLQDAPLHYPVPIINQQGQVAGKLLVGIQRVAGHVPEYMIFGGKPDDSSDSRGMSADVELDEDSSTSCDVSTDLEEDSDSSMSSGVGSSLSTDPTELRNPESNRIFEASTSSLSSASVSVIQSASLDTKRRRRKAMPQMTCKVTILEAQGLPVTLSHFVECQYTFLDCPDVIVVPPDLSPSEVSPKRSSFLNIRFNFSMEFTCNITEELVDRLTSNTSLAIEVWGHKDRYHKSNSSISSLTSSSIVSTSPPVGRKRRGKKRVKRMDKFSRGYSLRSEKTKSLKERWNEVVKRLQVEVSIQELTDAGAYEPVEVATKPEVYCVGTFQLKQGQSRRMHVKIEPAPNSGSLPLICESIASVYAGSIHCKSANEDRGLDSYQDRDLTDLREKWQRVLDRRKTHLDKQIKSLSIKENKTELEREKEHGLLDQWVALTEERNAVLAPTAESGVPGAPAAWLPPPSYEMHVPIIYLDLDSEPMGLGDVVRSPAGLDSEIPLEIPGTFVQLPFVRPPESDFRGAVSSLVSWDSSMHDTVLLNRVTPSNERIYVVVKIHVRLSHPVEMDLVLRKRVCASVYKQKGFATVLKRKMQGKRLLSSGVAYDVISNIPLATAENEDQESLAMLAASGAKVQDEEDTLEKPSSDEEEGPGSYFEKYVMRATRAVDDILTLDRIRQEVALRDAFARNSSLSPNRGVDVVSIISKRNKSRPSSVFSPQATPTRTPESNFGGSR